MARNEHGAARRVVGCVAAHDAGRAARAMTAHLRTKFTAIDRIAAAHPGVFDGIGTRRDEQPGPREPV